MVYWTLIGKITCSNNIFEPSSFAPNSYIDMTIYNDVAYIAWYAIFKTAQYALYLRRYSFAGLCRNNSATLLLSIIMAKLYNTRLDGLIEKDSILSNSQFGLKSGVTTLLPLLIVMMFCRNANTHCFFHDTRGQSPAGVVTALSVFRYTKSL